MDQRLALKIRKATGPLYKPLYISYLLLAENRHRRFFPDWFRSFGRGHSTLNDGIPLLPFAATSWLESYLRPEMKIFEYGSGGSTIFFAGKVSQVFSVEHDRIWYSAISENLARREVANVLYSLHEPRLVNNPLPVRGTQEADPTMLDEKDYKGLSFDTYVKSIDTHPDQTFDLILVDGRARSACIKRALPKIRPGGYLMLDNSSDADCGECLRVMQAYVRTDFRSIAPYWPPGRWRTSAWQMPSAAQRNATDVR